MQNPIPMSLENGFVSFERRFVSGPKEALRSPNNLITYGEINRYHAKDGRTALFSAIL